MIASPTTNAPTLGVESVRPPAVRPARRCVPPPVPLYRCSYEKVCRDDDVARIAVHEESTIGEWLRKIVRSVLSRYSAYAGSSSTNRSKIRERSGSSRARPIARCRRRRTETVALGPPPGAGPTRGRDPPRVQPHDVVAAVLLDVAQADVPRLAARATRGRQQEDRERAHPCANPPSRNAQQPPMDLPSETQLRTEA